jgi:hypothetical protein
VIVEAPTVFEPARAPYIVPTSEVAETVEVAVMFVTVTFVRFDVP